MTLADFQEEQGAGYWIAEGNTGPLVADAKGRMRHGPRMWVVGENGRWLLQAAYLGLGFPLFYGLCFVLWMVDDFDKANPIGIAVGGGMAVLHFAYAYRLIIFGIRFDALMPVVGAREVGGLHDDWPRVSRKAAPEHAPEPAKETEPTEIRIDDEIILPPDDGDLRRAS